MKSFLMLMGYSFVQRAAIVGVLVSICAALLGVILVLKRYSLIGHGLSDVSFASLSLALVLGLSPLLVSMPIIIITCFVIMYVSQQKKVMGDISIGIFSTSALAIGVAITALTKGFSVDIYSYMFGSILTTSQNDVAVSVLLACIVIATFIIFYNRLFIITIDEPFAKAQGISLTFYQFLISTLTAVTVVLGMRMMGTLLISSLIIFPTIIAKKFCKSFKGLMLVSSLLSAITFLIGLGASLVINIPTGAAIVITNLVLLILSTGFLKIFGSAKHA